MQSQQDFLEEENRKGGGGYTKPYRDYSDKIKMVESLPFPMLLHTETLHSLSGEIYFHVSWNVAKCHMGADLKD